MVGPVVVHSSRNLEVAGANPALTIRKFKKF